MVLLKKSTQKSLNTPLLGSSHTEDLRRQDVPTDPTKTSESTSRLAKFEHEVEEVLAHMSQATHYMTQGHSDSIMCVCADLGADCIVTGSKDGTMRVWKWDPVHSASFVLLGVIEHGTSVTAVACIEASGLVASGTDQGDIFYIDMGVQSVGRGKHRPGRINVKKAFHRGAVHDLSIKHCGIETSFVTLDKPTEKIMDNLEWDSRGLTVTKKAVESGIFKKWNEDHPTMAIKENYYIRKANGTDLSKLDSTECKKFLKEQIRQNKGLKLKVLRCCEDEVFIASGGDYFAKVVALKGASAPYSVTVLCQLEHGCKVSKVKFLEHEQKVKQDGWLSIDVRLLTSSLDGTRLWNINDSALLLKIDTAGSPDIRDASQIHGVAIPDNDQTMLISVLDDTVSVWNLHKAERQYSSSANLEVEREYEIAKENFEFFSGSQYIASSLEGHWVLSLVGRTVSMWSLDPPAKCLGCGAWHSDLESQIFAKSKAKQIQEFTHNDNVTALHVFEDPEDGGVLITGSENGEVVVWDVGGHDAGEIIARLRSLSFLEFVGPMVLMIISFVQVSAFATVGSHPGFLVQLTRANISLLFNGDRAYLFYVSTWSTLAFMTLFIALVLSETREKLRLQLNEAKGSASPPPPPPSSAKKRRKPKTTAPTENDKKVAENDKKVKLMQAVLNMVDIVIWTCCTVLIVPMSNTMVQAVACVPDEAVPERLVLQVAPEVQCFEGRHRNLVTVIAVVAPVFFFLVFPYAVVRGDSNYVQRAELMSIRAWKNNAIRKATIFHLGPFHPMADNVFVSVTVEVAAKMVLPTVDKLIHEPLSQMKVVTTIGVLLLAITLLFKPMIEDSWNAILISLRLWTVCAMGCAYLAVALDDPERPEPMCALGACTASVFVMALLYIINVQRTIDHHEVIRMNTVKSTAVSVNAKGVMQSTETLCQPAA